MSKVAPAAFTEGALVFVPVSCAKNAREVPATAKEEYGLNPTYLPAVASAIKGSYTLDWGGEEVESDIAYARTVEQGEELCDVDEIGNLQEINVATIIHLLHKRFAHKRYFTHMGKYCDIWVNPLHGADDNTNALMRDTRALCAKFGHNGVAAIRQQIAKSNDMEEINATTKTISHQLTPVYMKVDELYEELQKEKTSQTICFRGHSGSGKSTLYQVALQYLLYRNSTMGSHHISDTKPGGLSPSDRAKSTSLDFDPDNASDNLSLRVSNKSSFDLYFSPSGLAQSTIAALRVQNAFGMVAAGSSSELSEASKALTTARLVFAEKSGGDLHVEKVIYGLGCLDGSRLKPVKRTNMPPNVESTKMPYRIMLMFVAHLADNEAKQGQYGFKPAEIALYLAENVIGSAAVGMAELDGSHVTGTVDVNNEQLAWAKGFLKLKQSLFTIGMDDTSWEEVCTTLAIIVHFQMINIVGVDNAILSAASKIFLATIESLLGVDSGELLKIITKKTERNKISVVDNKAGDARAVCESMYSEIYKRLTSHLLAFCSNGGAKLVSSKGTVALNLVDLPASNGVIDGFGDSNNMGNLNHNSVPYRSFMDFCSNYALEKLHIVFVEECFNNEINKYRSENVVLKIDANIVPETKNGSTVFTEMFENPQQPIGFFSAIEEVSGSVKPDDKAMIDKILQMRFYHPTSKELLISGPKQKAGIKGFRSLAFLVTHSFGTVHYDGESFACLNKAAALFGVPESLGNVFLESSSIGVLKKFNNSSFNNSLDKLLSADNSNGCEEAAEVSTETATISVPSGGSYGSKGFKAFGGAGSNAKHFAVRAQQDSITLALSVLFSPTWGAASVMNSENHVKPNAHFITCVRPAPVTALIGLPTILPLQMNTHIVDSQIRAALVPQLAQLNKFKFAEPSRSFQAFYDRFKLTLPFHCHSAAAQESMRQEESIRDLRGLSNLTSSIIKNSVKSMSQFSCDAKYASNMIERLCEYMNKAEPNEEKVQTLGTMGPSFGITTIFLPKALHNALERYRDVTIQQYTMYSTLVQKRLRMKLRRKEYLRTRMFIIQLQSLFRSRSAQKEFARSMSKISYIKSKLIMLVYRGKYRRMKTAINHIKSWMLQKLVHVRVAHLLDNALYLHQLARGAVMRQRTNHVMAAIQTLQKCAMQFILWRRHLNTIRRSATCIQSLFRGWTSRNVNAALVNHLRQEKSSRLREKSSKVLQSKFRSHMVTLRKALVSKSVLKIQRWNTQIKARKSFLLALWLIQWLQKQCRYVIANNRINKMLERKMLIDAALQVAIIKQKEFEYASDKTLRDLCIGSMTHADGLNLTSMHILSMDVFSDVSLSYPEGWLSAVLKHVDTIYTENSSKKSITKIAMGSHHTVMLDDMSNVYSFGLGDGGQLGHGHRHSLAHPHVMDKLRHLMANSERGSKEAGGSGSASQGISRNTLSSGAGQVRDISCGREHTLLLTSGGRVWSWGSNKFGQLGHSNFESCAIPRQVIAGASGTGSTECGSMSSIATSAFKQIKQISAGGSHSAALTESGSLYTWGAAVTLGRKQGQSGTSQNKMHGFNSISAYQVNKRQLRVKAHKNDCEPGTPPFFCSNIRIPIAQVVCGDAHITVKCAATVRNMRTGVELYAWGNNSYGQLGIGLDKAVMLDPTRVKLPATVIESICTESKATNDSTAIKPENSSAPAYGVNAKPVVVAAKGAKFGTTEKNGVSTRLLYSEADMSNAVLATGGRHMILALKGDIWAWGWNQYGQIGDNGVEAVEEVVQPVRDRAKSSVVTIAGMEINADGTMGDNLKQAPKCIDAHVPKRIWAHGTFNSNGEMRAHIKTVSAGWRYSAAIAYMSNTGSTATSKSQSNSSGLYMWGAVSKEGSFLCNHGANLAASASIEDTSLETKVPAKAVPEESDASPAQLGHTNSSMIKTSKSFVKEWGSEMNKETYVTDSDSDSGEESAPGGFSGSAFKSRKKNFNQFEEEPTLVPTAVSIPQDTMGPITSVLSCSSSAFSVNIVTSKDTFDHKLKMKANSSPRVSKLKSLTVATLPNSQLESPKRAPLPPWHKPEKSHSTSPITFGLDQSVISNQFKSLKQSFVPGIMRLTENELSKGKRKEIDADTLTDDGRSVHSYNTGLTGDCSLTSLRARQSALLKAERKLVLTKARALELRAREKKMDPMALLSLFAPQVSKDIESKKAKAPATDTFDVSMNPLNPAAVTKASRKKSVFFKTSDTADEPDLSTDNDVAGLGLGLGLANNIALQVSSPTNTTPNTAPIAAARLSDNVGNVTNKTILDNVLESETSDIGAYSSEGGQFPARYSDVAFDYSTRKSPNASPSKGNSSPLRLNAVRDLAGLIEKIRFEPSNEK